MRAWKYIKGGRVLVLAKPGDVEIVPPDVREFFFGGGVVGHECELNEARPVVGADVREVIRDLQEKGWHLWPGSVAAS